MGFDLNQFIANGLVYGGARPSKFDIQMTIPPAATGTGGPTAFASKLQYTCKAASIPSFTLGQIQIPYFGRKIKSAGDRTWEDWRIEIMLDEDYQTRYVMEKWSNFINTLESNKEIVDTAANNPTGISGLSETEYYKGSALITHYAKDTTPIAQYSLIGVWPRQVGAITLDWDGTDRIAMFQCDLSFDYMVPVDVSGGGKSSNPIYSYKG